MRNLKRALSLTLASVMLLGMMVIGTSAASYPDVTEEHNVEAIEVLQAVGVMSGSDSGNFNPDQAVSRIEMAVVMSNLLNLKVDYFEGQCSFTDVPEWAGKYVAACENYGIVSGVGGGRFGVGDVTATQAALMMLKALGYFQYASDFGTNWAQETAKLAANLELFKGIDAVDNTVLTRNQVAQLALNTLKTPVVVAETSTPDITVGSGDTAVIINGKVNYKVTASSDAYARAISAVEGSDSNTINGIAGYVIELGEKLYSGKLQLRENGKGGAVVYDDFGRPARRWQYDGTTFGTYPKTEELRYEYTTKVTGKDLYDLLGSDLIRQYDINVTIDGEISRNILGSAYFTEASMIRTNTEKVGETGNGVLTQVYVDSVEHEVNIAIINTYLAKANQDYNSRDNDVDLRVYKIDGLGVNNAQYVKTADKEEIITVNGEDLPIEDVKNGDFYLVTVADGKIQSMVAPEIVSETTLNSFKEGDWVKNDDVQYDYASTAQYDDEVLDEYDRSNMQSVTYDIILDRYGYLIGIELNEELNQYLFLTGMDLGSSNLSAQNATANVVFLDGTMSTVTVNVAKSEAATAPSGKSYTITGGSADFDTITSGDGWSQVNTWCTYTVDANGIYTLKQVGNRSNARNDSTDPVKGAKKIAQSVMDVSSMGITPISGNLEISSKSVALDGSKAKNDTTNGDFTYVYGNDETVYINASLKKVTAKGGSVRAIVDKVDSATTGVKNVDMTVKNITATGDLDNSPGTQTVVPSGEVYVLYRDNGYVIGAVVLNAEDNGTTSNWAYITGNVNREDLVGNNQWRWSKNAIIDGKKVVLTEVDDSMDNLADTKTQRGGWYSLRFDKDGNVSSIKQETTGTDYINFGYSGTDKFITSVADVYNATNGVGSFTTKESSLLLRADYTCSTGTHSGPGARELKFENGTLYTNRDASEGFQIMPDANIVLITSKGHNTDIWDNITDGYVGWDGMQDALDALDSETSGGYSAFDGILMAVFRDGRATSVILHDQSGNGRPGVQEPVRPMTVTVNKIGSDGTNLGTDTISWTGASALTAPTVTGWTVTGTDSWATSNFVENGSGSVTFTYTKDPVKETKTLRISYRTTLGEAGTQVGFQNITVELDEAGFFDLTADSVDAENAKLLVVPEHYKIAAANNGLPVLVEATTTGVVPVLVEVDKASYVSDQPTAAELKEQTDGGNFEGIVPAISTGLTQTVAEDGKITISGQMNVLDATVEDDDGEILQALNVFWFGNDQVNDFKTSLSDIFTVFKDYYGDQGNGVNRIAIVPVIVEDQLFFIPVRGATPSASYSLTDDGLANGPYTIDLSGLTWGT